MKMDLGAGDQPVKVCARLRQPFFIALKKSTQTNADGQQVVGIQRQ